MANKKPQQKLTPKIVREKLELSSELIVRMLPQAYKSQHQRFIDRAALTFATSKNRDKLEQCTAGSVITAVITAAEYGFALDDKFVYAIPYNNTVGRDERGQEIKQYECQATFDYKALVAVARRHQLVIDVRAQDVREKDEFEWYEEDFKQRYRFKKASGNRGEIVGAYAVVDFPNGGHRFEHMDREELDKVHSASKSPKSPAWLNWKARMFCKAVVKRTLTYVQDDATLGSLIELDNREYDMDKVVDAVGVSESRAQSMNDLAQTLSKKVSKGNDAKPAIESKSSIDYGSLLSVANSEDKLLNLRIKVEEDKSMPIEQRLELFDEIDGRIEHLEMEKQEES